MQVRPCRRRACYFIRAPADFKNRGVVSGAAYSNTFFPTGPTGNENAAPKSHPLRLFKFVLSIPTIVPLLVMMGWIFRIETAKSIAPKLVAMNPMVAVGFIAATIGLWVFRLGGKGGWQKWTCRVCAAIVMFIGGARMISYMSDADFGIDHWLFPARVGKSHIDPNSALNFVLLGA